MATVNLDRSVRSIVLRFAFSNRNIVPARIKRLAQETPEEFHLRQSRNAQGNGVSVIGPVANVSLRDFVSGLTGYEMVDAFYQERINPKDPNWTYPMVRFAFARHEHAKPTDDFRRVRVERQLELGVLCSDAMWRVRALYSPYREGIGRFPERMPLTSPWIRACRSSTRTVGR